MKTFGETFAEAKTGSESAQAHLYRQYAARIFGAVRRRLTRDLRQKFDSSDIVQSVFAEVVRDLPRLEDRGEDAFRHWLYIKTQNKVRSKMRKTLGRDARRKESPLAVDLTSPAESPARTIERQETTHHLNQIVDGLDDEARTVVLLRLEGGLRFAQIAERMALVSSEAARKRYARAIRQLRDRFPHTPS